MQWLNMHGRTQGASKELVPASIEWLLADGAAADMTLGALEDLEDDGTALDKGPAAADHAYDVGRHLGDGHGMHVLADGHWQHLSTLEEAANDGINQVSLPRIKRVLMTSMRGGCMPPRCRLMCMRWCLMVAFCFLCVCMRILSHPTGNSHGSFFLAAHEIEVHDLGVCGLVAQLQVHIHGETCPHTFYGAARYSTLRCVKHTGIKEMSMCMRARARTHTHKIQTTAGTS